VGENASPATRDSFRKKLREGDLNDKEIEISVRDVGGPPMFEIPGMPGANMGMINMSDMLGKAFGGARTKKRRMSRWPIAMIFCWLKNPTSCWMTKKSPRKRSA
jgi:ATP-dependent HslUV protease ATP-binding subunit HslU